MGLWKNIKNAFKQDASGTNTNVSGSKVINSPLDINNWSAAITSDKAKVLETNEEIYSIITRLSNLIASLPIHAYKKFEISDNINVAQLLRTEPNMNMSGYEFINRMEVARDTTGNGFAWIERDPSDWSVKALWPIDAGYVTVMRNTDDNSIWYQVDDNENHHFLLDNSSMLHVKHISPMNGELGISPIDVLRGTLSFQNAVQDFSLNEMRKKESYIITYDNSVSEESRDAILQSFRRMVNSYGGAILVENGYKVERYESAFKPSDLETIESITHRRIANAFNVPLSFLNDGQAKATTNVEHVMTDFAINTLVPIVRQYEAEFNRKLLTPAMRSRGYYFKFNINGLLRGDTAARTQFYQMLIRNGVATQNELRKLEDLPPVKEHSADVLWISKDLFPSENQLKASDTEAASSQTESSNEEPKDNGSENTSNLKGGGTDGQKQGNKSTIRKKNAKVSNSKTRRYE